MPALGPRVRVGAYRAVATHANSNEAAIAQKRPRQPITGSTHCTGNVDATMPSEPVISIHEFARNCVTGSKPRRNAVSGAIRQALTPTPVSARATARLAKLCATAKAAQPSAATASNTSCTRRGPWRSSALPNGSWVDAKPRK